MRRWNTQLAIVSKEGKTVYTTMSAYTAFKARELHSTAQMLLSFPPTQQHTLQTRQKKACHTVGTKVSLPNAQRKMKKKLANSKNELGSSKCSRLKRALEGYHLRHLVISAEQTLTKSECLTSHGHNFQLHTVCMHSQHKYAHKPPCFINSLYVNDTNWWSSSSDLLSVLYHK